MMYKRLVAVVLAAGAILAPMCANAYMYDYEEFNDNFSLSDMALFKGYWDYWVVPVLFVPNGGEGGVRMTRYEGEFDVPKCPFMREGHEFTGWKVFDACLYPATIGGTITSCTLPSGETYDWTSSGYAGQWLPGETYSDLCGVLVCVAQWREIAPNQKYNLTVSVDPGHKGGSVSGGGSYLPGQTVTLKATPKKGYCFSEWKCVGTSDDSADRWQVVDWETASRQKPVIKIKMPRGATKIVARFIKAKSDYIVFDGKAAVNNWYVQENGEEFWVQAGTGTLIKSFKAKGLPKGVAFVREFYGCYILRVTNAGLLAPGKVYTVVVTVTTASGKSKSVKVRIHGPNRRTAVDKQVLNLDTSFNGYEGGYSLRAGVKFDWDDLGIYAANGWKITKVTGLPGVKWNAAKQKMTGVVSKKGTYFVTFTVSRGKISYTATATFRVSGLPSAVTGVFNGITSTDYDWDEDDGADLSLPYYMFMKNARLDSSSKNVKVAVTSAGKVTAKVGGVSFSGTGLTHLSNSVYKVSLKRSQKITSGSLKGCTRSWSCEFEIDGSAPWNSMQLKGVFWSLGNNCIASMGGPEFMVAQRNPFGKNSSKKYVNAAAGKIATRLSKYGAMKTGSSLEGPGVYGLGGPACMYTLKGYKFPLSFKVSTAGAVAVAGKLGGIAVSGASVLRIAPTTWVESPWPPYEYVYDEATGTGGYEWSGRASLQADFCLTVAKKAVRIHVEFSPDNGVCRHGWVTIGSHRWNEYRDYDIDDDW